MVEPGTHEELISAGGRYARMFAIQAQRFATRSDTDPVDGDLSDGDLGGGPVDGDLGGGPVDADGAPVDVGSPRSTR